MEGAPQKAANAQAKTAQGKQMHSEIAVVSPRRNECISMASMTLQALFPEVILLQVHSGP